MPELPEVEATVRLLGAATLGAEVDTALVTAVSTLKSYRPQLSALDGKTVEGMIRRGKHLIINFSGDLALLMHLMSAGRFQLFDKEGSLRDKTLRLVIRLADGRELRLREFGTRQSCWAKVMTKGDLELDEALSTLGPDAWPDPPPFKALLDSPRPLHGLLRDQRVIAGIGRSWVDEILHRTRLSPFSRGETLTDEGSVELRASTIEILGGAIDHYADVLSIPIPDKMPMPLRIHRHESEPCFRCGTRLEAVHFEDHTMTYCPTCQTGGKLLKDRRLSRLIK